MYDQLTLGFYCDLEYNVLKLFEHWIEYIASGSNQSKANPGYFVRMRYPDTYKCKSGFSITKFEKDKKSATPVSYDGSQVMRVNVTLSYDTYQCGKASSVAIARGEDANNNPAQLNNALGANSAPDQASGAAAANGRATTGFVRPLGQDIGIQQRGTVVRRVPEKKFSFLPWRVRTANRLQRL
jgi:hypothetical protein